MRFNNPLGHILQSTNYPNSTSSGKSTLKRPQLYNSQITLVTVGAYPAQPYHIGIGAIWLTQWSHRESHGYIFG